MSFVERLVVNEEAEGTILYDEHIVRYELAKGSVKGKTVLDIATGSGYGAHILLQAGAKKIIGIDADSTAIEEAKQRYSHDLIDFKIGNAESLDIIDNSIEVITSFETIEHLGNYKKYLQELARVLTGEGVAFISTPNRDVFGQKNPYHIKEFTKEEFISGLKECFAHVLLLEQKNGLASVISGTNEQEEGNILIQDKNSPALYFIAVCSQVEISEKFQSIASVNIRALKRWENNKGWKLVNMVYTGLQKIGFFKS
jgi:ubiquinone/menaquinone biosynthesis C-methylase UbiE